MNRLATHPALRDRREAFEPMTDNQQLGFHLGFIVSLDPEAVYETVAGSCVVYYISPHATHIAPGECGRLVLTPSGRHRRIDKVGFDPR